MPISDELKKIVACPKCKGPLIFQEQDQGFDCNACKLRFLIEDDIPNFLIEEAQPLEDHD